MWWNYFQRLCYKVRTNNSYYNNKQSYKLYHIENIHIRQTSAIKYTFGKINPKKFHLLGITTSRCEVEFVFGSKDEIFGSNLKYGWRLQRRSYCEQSQLRWKYWSIFPFLVLSMKIFQSPLEIHRLKKRKVHWDYCCIKVAYHPSLVTMTERYFLSCEFALGWEVPIVGSWAGIIANRKLLGLAGRFYKMSVRSSSHMPVLWGSVRDLIPNFFQGKGVSHISAQLQSEVKRSEERAKHT